jgi:hypothetical protein
MPPMVVPTLQSLPHTPYRCQLSSHPFDPHYHFCSTQRLRLAAPPHYGHVTPGSSA